MGLALNRLAAEDPSFRVKTDDESGQTIMKGMGELAPRHPGRPHEARVQGRGEHRCAAGGLPRDHHQGEIDYTHKKQSGGSGQFARVKISSSRDRADSEDFVFEARSSVARFRRNTSRASKRASKSVMTPVRWPASRCSTSR
jgi:elongation factor G